MVDLTDKKFCTKCGELKPLAEFHASIGNPDGLQKQCKPCKLRVNAEWRAKNRGKVAASKRKYYINNWERIREHEKQYREKTKVSRAEYSRRYALARRYGINIDIFTEALERQGGGCAICGRKDGRQVVDHCHSTGKFRGILCVRCNVAIGSLGDSSAKVMRAVEYLRRAEAENPR